MEYAKKKGVSKASRKYDKSRSYIYFWLKRYDGTIQSLACRSRRPHRHPNQHTEEEIKQIKDMRRRNPALGMIEFWHRLRQRGYTRCPESLFRVMRRLKMFPKAKPKKEVCPEALRANAISGTAGTGRRQGGSSKLHSRPAAPPVPIYRDRRIFTAAVPLGLRRTKHLLLCGLSAQDVGMVQAPGHHSGMCADRQWH